MRNLSNLRPTPGSRRKRKRVGRGDGSGHGTYSGRGIKGQKARSGYSRRAGFEGGQTPLWRRIPKRGFVNIHRREYAYVNLDELMAKYDDGAEVTPEDVLDRGMVDDLKAGLKVLGRGDCDKALTVRAHKVSKSAREKIEAAGGHVILLEPEADVSVESGASTDEGTPAEETAAEEMTETAETESAEAQGADETEASAGADDEASGDADAEAEAADDEDDEDREG